ncbi:MAG: T9SS type A sorting domain-containing protein [Draconibacterium sp.]|nr:T9SS type A sorting domain-containing protein [Draconibacterium sp.]
MKWLQCIGFCIIMSYNVVGQNETYSLNLKSSLLGPVSSYLNNFEDGTLDIYSIDFEISNLPGITGKVLHTPQPYPVSDEDGGTRNLVAQLMHPIILNSEAVIKFDEIVLVEPSGLSTKSKESNSGDFVTVEASKNNGLTWYGLIEGYNSDVDVVWNHIFLNSIVNCQSWAEGTQSIFKKRRINLTDGINFFEGDTILVRFRLSSDHTINGWGWAIDNLAIEQSASIDDNLFSENFNIYPNPCNSTLHIDYSHIYGPDMVNLIITNMSGKIVYKEDQIAYKLNNSNKVIDLSGLSPGIYMLNITDNSYYSKTKKIIKN